MGNQIFRFLIFAVLGIVRVKGIFSILGNLTLFPEIPQYFDYIVVGSGSAGSVLASRLSENSNWNVLLLEAGVEPTHLADIPALCAAFQFTDYNWGYLMEEQENMCLGLKNKRMHWPRGKVLGGTSVINYMIHIRGNPHDFDRWAEAGNAGWSYQEVLPFFKKHEDCVVRRQDAPYRNQGGEIGVQDVPAITKSAEAFVEAMQEYGYEYVDYNGGKQMGVSFVQATTRRGKRESGVRAFLDVARYRKNLRITMGARVSRVVFEEGQNNKLRAVGVEFYKNGLKYFARANKEVILSAGALNSPQILMLSGIGPKDHLSSMGIALVKDLPVGQKLYDHLTFLGLVFTMTGEKLTFNFDDLYAPDTLLQYATRGEGPLTSLGGVEALGIVKTKVSDDPDVTYPDMELIFIGGGMHTDRGLIYRKTFRIGDETYDKIWKPLEDKQAFMILPMLYHPKSVGKLELRSNNPFSRPKFYGNYLTDKDGLDMKTFIAAIRMAQEIVKMPAMQKYNATLVDTPIPGCEEQAFDSDDYWECAVRHLSATLHHQISTCKMGNSTDPEAIVDNTLTVYGTENLRVADTSIIPEPITAHTNIPAYMIGEKMADMLNRLHNV